MLKMLLMAQLIVPTLLNKPLPSKKSARSTTANYIVFLYMLLVGHFVNKYQYYIYLIEPFLYNKKYLRETPDI